MPVRSDAALTLLLLGTVMVWGAAFTGIKILLDALGPVDMAVARFLVAALPFLVLWAVLGRRWRRSVPMDASGALRLFLLAALAVPGYHVSLKFGEAMLAGTQSHDVAASVSALLVATTPIFTFLLAVPLLGERATRRRAAGLLIALLGVALLVVWGRGVRMEPAAIQGALVVLGAPLCWATYSVFVKRELARAAGPLPLTTYIMLSGTLLLVPAMSWDLPFRLTALSAWHAFWLLWLGLLATFGGYVVWNVALTRWDATRVAAFVYLVPVSGILWAVVLGGERVTWGIAAGGALVLMGVWLASSRRAVPGAASTAPPPRGAPR